MLRHKIIVACSIALLLGGLAITSTASAESIGDCCLTGYTFMGGGIAYTSTPSNPAKDYFLAQALVEESQGYWGYGWVKFDNLETEAVSSAYLVYDLLGVGSMAITPASPENPADLDIYSPGTTDVEDLGGDASLRATLQASLTGSSPLYGTIAMTSNGLYCVDITDVYNGWVNDPTTNNGLVFASEVGTKYASFGNASGSTPYISTVAVPEPSTLLLLVAGMGMLAVSTRQRTAV